MLQTKYTHLQIDVSISICYHRILLWGNDRGVVGNALRERHASLLAICTWSAYYRGLAVKVLCADVYTAMDNKLYNTLMKTTHNDEISLVKEELAEMKGFFSHVLSIIPSFDITDPKILPYGLRPHTRSISWIVEQVITQQAKYHKNALGADEVEFDMPDTCLHDCVVVRKGVHYFVNVKITNIDGKQNKNDIAAVEKLYSQYKANDDYRLIYVVFGIIFNNVTISFDKEIHTFSPQFLPVYVQPQK